MRKIIYFGVYLIHDLSAKTQDAIVSYGERLSSQIVATLIDGAKWFDSREFIKTEFKNNKHLLDSELTNQLVRKAFADLPHISLVPGFISRDKNNGETTNLGRGGSDYTAAIIAAALNADILNIFLFLSRIPHHHAYRRKSCIVNVGLLCIDVKHESIIVCDTIIKLKL